MELIFQVTAGATAGLTADTSAIGVARNENMSVTPNAHGTNFFMSLNLTALQLAKLIEQRI
jgi:hypothetical protein